MITSSRFVFAALLLFTAPLSVMFWVFYGLAATSDLIDGPISRRLKANTNFGAALDTSADIFFLICIMVCVFPILEITTQSYILIGFVFLFKIISLAYAYLKFKKIVSYHTLLTKFLALFIFTFPIWVAFIDVNIIVIVLATLQNIAYTEELLITRKSEIPDANTKSVFSVRRD